MRVGPTTTGESCTTISIVSDTSYENDENFAIDFDTTATNVAVLPRRVEVTILDDDSKEEPPVA